MKNNKKAYLAPMVEVMNARVEKGFAGSGSAPINPNDPTQPITPSGRHANFSMGMMEDFD